MKASRSSFGVLALTTISLLLLPVAVRSASGSTVNLGHHHKTLVVLHEIPARISSHPAAHPANEVSSGRRTEQRKKSIPNQGANGLNKATISREQASAVATAAAAAAAFFGAAL